MPLFSTCSHIYTDPHISIELICLKLLDLLWNLTDRHFWHTLKHITWNSEEFMLTLISWEIEGLVSTCDQGEHLQVKLEYREWWKVISNTLFPFYRRISTASKNLKFYLSCFECICLHMKSSWREISKMCQAPIEIEMCGSLS